MTDYLENVTRRKAALISVAEAQRQHLSQVVAVCAKPARVIGTVNSFVRNPLVLAGFGLAMAKMPWRRLFKVSRLAYKGYKAVKLFQVFRRFAL